MRQKISSALTEIKREHIFILLVLTILVSLFIKPELPVTPGAYSRKFFNEIDSIKEGREVSLQVL